MLLQFIINMLYKLQGKIIDILLQETKPTVTGIAVLFEIIIH